jgi:DNA repair protein RadC
MPNAMPSAQPRLPLGLDYTAVMEAFAQYVTEERPRLIGPADVAGLMRPVLAAKPQEEFHALLLDTKHGLIADEVVTVGLVDRSQVHAREVFRQAISAGCSRIVLVHNHPSNDPTPSAEDLACTRDLVAAGKLIGIEVLDHVILGRRTPIRLKDYLSFREENLL